MATASYALLSTSFSVLGFAAHATHFVMFFALAGILVLLKAVETQQSSQLFASGFLLGLAFLMKQPGIVFAVFGGLYLSGGSGRLAHPLGKPDVEIWLVCHRRNSAVRLVCLILLYAGVFKTFLVLGFYLCGSVWIRDQFLLGARRFTEIFPAIVAPAIGVWIIAALGLAAVLWDRESRARAGFVCGFLFFSFLAVCPHGFFFREHYFILMLPAVAVLSGIAVESVRRALASVDVESSYLQFRFSCLRVLLASHLSTESVPTRTRSNSGHSEALWTQPLSGSGRDRPLY